MQAFKKKFSYYPLIPHHTIDCYSHLTQRYKVLQRSTAHVVQVKPALHGAGCRVLCHRTGTMWQQTPGPAKCPVPFPNWCQTLDDALKLMYTMSARWFSLQCNGGCFHLKRGSFCYCLTQCSVLLHFSMLNYIGPSLLKHRGNLAVLPQLVTTISYTEDLLCKSSQSSHKVCWRSTWGIAKKQGPQILPGMVKQDDSNTKASSGSKENLYLLISFLQ